MKITQQIIKTKNLIVKTKNGIPCLLIVLLVAACSYLFLATEFGCGPYQANGDGDGEEFPEFPDFPWPPPQASAMGNLLKFFRIPGVDVVRLRDVDNRLSRALDIAGYVEKSYYAVPKGFALVTRLEQINPDGTPKSGFDRWAIEAKPLDEFSLSAYLRALFTSEPGYFRIIVFIVTPYPFGKSDKRVSRDDAIAWLHSKGFNRLPDSVGKQPYSEKYVCTALIYEFEKERGKEDANTLIPGRLSTKTHLENSAILDGLRRQ